MAIDGRKAAAIPSSLRLLTVIEAVARAGAPLTPTEANTQIGLPKPTIHRLFATLEAEGFLERDLAGGGYSPGPRARRLAAGILSSAPIRTARRAILERLSREIGETCNIALPDRNAMIYLERVETDWPLRIQLPIGARVPLHCTASGKMCLSALPSAELDAFLASSALERRTPNTLTDRAALSAEIEETRARGYALDREEFLADMIALAVPIFEAGGRLIATLSFHAPTLRYDVERAIAELPKLRDGARALAELANGDGP